MRCFRVIDLLERFDKLCDAQLVVALREHGIGQKEIDTVHDRNKREPRTLLSMAIIRERWESFQLLLELGANPNGPGNPHVDLKPLEVLARSVADERSVPYAEALLEALLGYADVVYTPDVVKLAQDQKKPLLANFLAVAGKDIWQAVAGVDQPAASPHQPSFSFLQLHRELLTRLQELFKQVPAIGRKGRDR